MGIFLGGTLQSAVRQTEGDHEIPAVARKSGGLVALRRCEPSLHPGRRAVRLGEELLQPVVAQLPRKFSLPEQVLEELFHEGPPRRVVAGKRAKLCFCSVWRRPGAEDLRQFRASGARRGETQPLIPGREVSGGYLDRLAVVWPEEPWVGAANVNVHRGLFSAPAEGAWLWED